MILSRTLELFGLNQSASYTDHIGKYVFLHKAPLWENTRKLHHPSSPIVSQVLFQANTVSSLLNTFKEEVLQQNSTFSYSIPDKIHTLADPANEYFLTPLPQLPTILRGHHLIVEEWFLSP